MSSFKTGCTHLLLQSPRFFSGQSQQKVVADGFAKHCCFFAPCVADDVTGLFVMGCDWDHKNQKRTLLPTATWFIQYERVLVRVCHKVWWCWDLWRQRRLGFLIHRRRLKTSQKKQSEFSVKIVKEHATAGRNSGYIIQAVVPVCRHNCTTACIQLWDNE